MKKSITEVIIIDDNFLKDIDPRIIKLKKYFEVVTLISSPNEGVKYVQSRNIDRIIVLLDYKFGDKDPNGYWVLEEIRKTSYVIPVILMTENSINSSEFSGFINDKTFSYVNDKSESGEILKKVLEADSELNTRVEVVIEDWINRHSPEDKEKPYLSTRNGETYSLNKIMTEIRLQTDFGKKMEIKVLKLAIELLARDIEKLG